MTNEQESIIRNAGIMIANHAISLAGYPSVISDFYADLIAKELQKINSVIAEMKTEADPCNQAAA